MVEVVEGGRLYFPPADENQPDDRKVMHPETDAQQVIMGNGQNLEDVMKTGRMIVSSEQPTEPCIWAETKESYTL